MNIIILLWSLVMVWAAVACSIRHCIRPVTYRRLHTAIDSLHVFSTHRYSSSSSSSSSSILRNSVRNIDDELISVIDINRSLTDSSTGSSMDEHYEELKLQIEILKKVKEKRQLDYTAAELALLRLQQEVHRMDADRCGGESTAVYLKSTDSSSSAGAAVVDYGFVSKSFGGAMGWSSDVLRSNATASESSTVPPSAVVLALNSFRRELRAIFTRAAAATENETSQEATSETSQEAVAIDSRLKLSQLRLSNDAIWQREERRPAIKAPWVIKVPYYVLCWVLDRLFEGDPISRFYYLETVARMPYFSYITMLHTYETLGWWRRSTEAKRVHFAEEYNEYHHLLIWESLGGDQHWRVRFLAQHSAIAYYFGLIALWILSPSLAYNFSELIEAHAVDTYAEFADSNKELLQSMAAPAVAKQYYENPDMYVFDEFQTGRVKGSRRPMVNTLFDVVTNIRDDEAQHVSTMALCQDPAVVLRSPNTEAAVLTVLATASLLALVSQGQFSDFEVTDGRSILDYMSGPANSLNAAANEAVSSITAATKAAADAFGVKLSTSGTIAEDIMTTDGSDQLVEGAGDAAGAEGGLLEGLIQRIVKAVLKFIF